MVSSTSKSYRASLVRLTHGGGQVTTEGFSVPLEMTARKQPYRRGSYMTAQLPAWPAWQDGGAAVQCWVYPTSFGGQQCLMALGGPRGWWELRLDGDSLALCHTDDPDGAGGPVVVSPLRARPNRWYFVSASLDIDHRRAGLAAVPCASPGQQSPRPVTRWSDGPVVWSPPTTAMVAAGLGDREAVRHFNGKIDSPRIFSRCLVDADFEALAVGADPRSVGGLAVAWSFDPVHDSNTGTVLDFGPIRAHAKLVNLPTLGVPGRNWTGADLDFSLAPEEYRAAHF